MVASGHDFSRRPRLSPDGRRVAWLTWDHPRMPWDGTELWTAELAGDGTLSGERLVAGGPDESILQPQWSPAGELWFASDRNGWWNLCDRARAAASRRSTPAGSPTAAAHRPRGRVREGPVGLRPAAFVFLDDGTLAVGVPRTAAIILRSSYAPRRRTLPARPRCFASSRRPTLVVHSLAPLGDRLALIAGMHTQGLQVAVVDPRTSDSSGCRRGRPVLVDPAYISRPEAIVVPH